MLNADKINCLRLMMTDHIGPITFRHLLDFYGSASEAILHINELAHHGGCKKDLNLVSKTVAEKQLELADKNKARLIYYQDDDYPSLLKKIPDSAPILFIKGHIETLHKKSISIVGTRNASVNGKMLARKISFDLVEHDYDVVSGMARGIDRAAHMGALSSSKIGTTTAVLGTPIDEIYPEENKDIYDEIIDRGCLVSEFPFGTPLSPYHFPRRNRVISGLSLGTVVIEAQQKSGSLITAREALSQGREVMAVPGSPVDPRSEGPNSLIRDGAGLISSAQDIIDIVENLSHFSLKEQNIDQKYTLAPLDENTLTEARDIVWHNLGADIISVDDLVSETGLDVRIVNIILVELEIAGRLERYPGNRISLAYQME